MFRNLVALLMSCAVVGLSACESSGYRVVSAQEVADQTVAETPEYRIGPGDSLSIFVWDQPTLSTNVTVRPDGEISTPLVEDLTASGRTPTELAREIEVVLGEYVRSPVVTVQVQGFVGEREQQIRVVGEAAQPRVLQYSRGMTVLDVMISVGGLSDLASGNRARVMREINGETVEIRVRLDDLLNGGAIQEDISMLPGDVLVIPRTIL
jgi:polysaccharide export outer membrane protein